MNELVELIAPVLCVLIFIDVLIKRQKIFSRESSIFFIAITVFVLWALVNYMRNPVLGMTAFGTGYEQGGIRSYYLIIVGIATFLCSFWFFRDNELNVPKWFKFLIAVTLILGLLRLFSYFYFINIPFLSGAFELGKEGAVHDTYYRIGGLGGMAALGLSALLSLFYEKKWTILPSIIFASYLLFVFLSGGRQVTFSIALSIIGYTFFVNRKYIIQIISGSFLLILALFIMSYVIELPGQAERLTSIKEVSPQSFQSRYYAFKYMWNLFVESPIFGKGIGYIEVQIDDNFFDKDLEKWEKDSLRHFIKGQVFKGGHGAWFSVLSTFGIGGIFFLAVMVFGGAFYAYKVIKDSNSFQPDKKMAIFVFAYLLMIIGFFITAGKGYDNMKMWFIVGMIAGINAKKKIHNISEYE
jgi:hypothetical protein